jgi:hypothetical protein
MENGPYAMLSPVFPKEGVSLFETVKNRELEGIVAKGNDTPYIIGKKSNHWLKIKNRRRQQVVIGGYITASGNLKSILVGAFGEDKLIYLGASARDSGKQKKSFSLFSKPCPGKTPPLNPHRKLIATFGGWNLCLPLKSNSRNGRRTSSCGSRS